MDWAEGTPEEGGCASSEGQEDDELFSDTEPARTPRSSSSREERSRRPSLPAWLSWAGASALGSLVMALVVLVVVRPSPSKPEPVPAPWLATPEELAQFATDGGVAEEALASVEAVPSAGVPYNSLGRSMPKQPFPGQRKPPCAKRGEKEINGGCWSGPP